MNNSPEDQTDQDEDVAGNAAHEAQLEASARARQKMRAQREEMARRRCLTACDGEEPEVAVPVGYGAPPVSTQFKPGISGNPTGRPRGSKNKAPNSQKLRELILAVGDRRGEDGNGSRIEKVVAALHNEAEGDNVAAMKLVLQLRAIAEAERDEEQRQLEAQQINWCMDNLPEHVREQLRISNQLMREFQFGIFGDGYYDGALSGGRQSGNRKKR